MLLKLFFVVFRFIYQQHSDRKAPNGRISIRCICLELNRSRRQFWRWFESRGLSATWRKSSESLEGRSYRAEQVIACLGRLVKFLTLGSHLASPETHNKPSKKFSFFFFPTSKNLVYNYFNFERNLVFSLSSFLDPFYVTNFYLWKLWRKLVLIRVGFSQPECMYSPRIDFHSLFK